jgi:hypothetical protein
MLQARAEAEDSAQAQQQGYLKAAATGALAHATQVPERYTQAGTAACS